jgi:hypothetical protein
VGYQIGRVHNDTSSYEATEREQFSRMYGSVETLFRIKRSVAIDAATLLELTSSGNFRYLTEPGVEHHQVSLAAAYPLTSAVWVQLNSTTRVNLQRSGARKQWCWRSVSSADYVGPC